MNTKKCFAIGLLMSGLILSGCSGNKGNNKPEPPTPEEEIVYTITESEYTSIRSFLNSTDFLVEGNVTISGSVNYKFGTRRVECVDGDIHNIFDFIYDDLADEYRIDEYDEQYADHWNKTEWALGELTLEEAKSILNLPFDFMPLAYANLIYSEETHKYSGMIGEYPSKAGFENGQLTSFEFEYDDGTKTYALSNYGTTVINLPSVE